MHFGSRRDDPRSAQIMIQSAIRLLLPSMW
jgi:hypothetical protein